MRKSRTAMNASFLLAAALCGTALTAHAAENAPLAGCVDLGSDKEVVRAGSTRSMLLRNADSHYLLTFRDDCGSLPMTSTIRIIGDGTEDRLCPGATTVQTRREDCAVSSIETLDAKQFASRKRRAR